jgi:hypothetical protein
MKILSLSLLLAIAGLAQRGWAEEAQETKAQAAPAAEESPYSIYQHAQVPTEAQQAKILSVITLDTSYSAPKINYEIQNGLADFTVVGFIVTVSYKNTDTGKDMSFEIFANCSAAPLSSYGGQLELFDASKTASFHPKLEIKDFRIKKLPDGK